MTTDKRQTGFHGVKAQLKIREVSQSHSLLAFAISVSGTEDCFPALLGVSVRSKRSGVVNLMPYEVLRAGLVVCLVEHPSELGNPDLHTSHLYSGEITFAMWHDKTYQAELARIPWREWVYLTHNRMDACTAAYCEHDFEAMQQRYIGNPHWIAHRMEKATDRP
jgi:hypothetical protein